MFGLLKIEKLGEPFGTFNATTNGNTWTIGNLMTDEDTVTISRRTYIQLLGDMEWRTALEASGVDNWEWYGDAMELYEKQKEARGLE